MTAHPKIGPAQLRRQAAIYIRQSSPGQVINNRESTLRQYGLVERAVDLGWDRSQVVIFDEDLGVSASGSVTRLDFERLVAEVGLGRIGLVLGLEVSRLARNNRDWYRLLDLCAMVETLVGDSEGIYHPGSYDDRLVLGLKGTISEAELHLIRSRLQGGIREKARRGELRVQLAVGYDYDTAGHVILSPDEAVRSTISLIFSKFQERGSARQAASYFAEANLPLPYRRPGDPATGWHPPSFAAVYRILNNPTYAGAYAYGRSRTERNLDEAGKLVSRRLSLLDNEWEVLIEDHHEGYITMEQYRANLRQLRANVKPRRGEAGGAVREGRGLLQGIIRCGVCGRRMTVVYSGRANQPHRYLCRKAHRLPTDPRCQSLGGVGVDQAVAGAFLQVLAPASVEAAVGALQDAESRWQAELGQRGLLVEQARFEAGRARRQYDRVEPENRLVARSLERVWEEALSEVVAREAELDRFRRTKATALCDEEIDWLRSAGVDLKQLWEAPTTTGRDRKQLLRCLVTEVIVTADRTQGVMAIKVIWVGGRVTPLACKIRQSGDHRFATDEETLDLMAKLAPGHDDTQIARVFNTKGLRTGRDNVFTAERVAHLRRRLGLGPPEVPLQDADQSQWVSARAAAAELGVTESSITRWAREGFLEANQATPYAPWRIRITDDVRARLVPDVPPGWVGLDQAARILGRSKQTIVHWVQSGKLPVVQVVSGKRKGLRINVSSQVDGLFE